MNKSDISKEKIISLSLGLLRETGDEDLNMRKVAQAAGAAVGSLYNYFPTKVDLILAVIEQVWNQAFQCGISPADTDGFPAFVAAVYGQVYAAQKDYHNFFVRHRTLISSSQKTKGRHSMSRYIAGLHTAFLRRLHEDGNVRDNFWTPDFTPEQLVEFTFSSMLSALSRDECNCAYLCKVLERLLYYK